MDAKGRFAIPVRYRDAFPSLRDLALVITVNPWDRALWLYPLDEWELIETKLSPLTDFDKQSRRTKQIMRGYATDCLCDGQGGVLLPLELREIAGIDKQAVLLGQGNKLELWDGGLWQAERDSWLKDVGQGSGAPSSALESLSL